MDNHISYPKELNKYIKYDLMHTTHFRIYTTGKVSISTIVFDYNYFFCFFKPTVIKFHSKKATN
jgi:hypothetical protein